MDPTQPFVESSAPLSSRAHEMNSSGILPTTSPPHQNNLPSSPSFHEGTLHFTSTSSPPPPRPLPSHSSMKLSTTENVALSFAPPAATLTPQQKQHSLLVPRPFQQKTQDGSIIHNQVHDSQIFQFPDVSPQVNFMRHGSIAVDSEVKGMRAMPATVGETPHLLHDAPLSALPPSSSSLIPSPPPPHPLLPSHIAVEPALDHIANPYITTTSASIDDDSCSFALNNVFAVSVDLASGAAATAAATTTSAAAADGGTHNKNNIDHTTFQHHHHVTPSRGLIFSPVSEGGGGGGAFVGLAKTASTARPSLPDDPLPPPPSSSSSPPPPAQASSASAPSVSAATRSSGALPLAPLPTKALTATTVPLPSPSLCRGAEGMDLECGSGAGRAKEGIQCQQKPSTISPSPSALPQSASETRRSLRTRSISVDERYAKSTVLNDFDDDDEGSDEDGDGEEKRSGDEKGSILNVINQDADAQAATLLSSSAALPPLPPPFTFKLLGKANTSIKHSLNSEGGGSAKGSSRSLAANEAKRNKAKFPFGLDSSSLKSFQRSGGEPQSRIDAHVSLSSSSSAHHHPSPSTSMLRSTLAEALDELEAKAQAHAIRRAIDQSRHAFCRRVNDERSGAVATLKRAHAVLMTAGVISDEKCSRDGNAADNKGEGSVAAVGAVVGSAATLPTISPALLAAQSSLFTTIAKQTHTINKGLGALCQAAKYTKEARVDKLCEALRDTRDRLSDMLREIEINDVDRFGKALAAFESELGIAAEERRLLEAETLRCVQRMEITTARGGGEEGEEDKDGTFDAEALKKGGGEAGDDVPNKLQMSSSDLGRANEPSTTEDAQQHEAENDDGKGLTTASTTSSLGNGSSPSSSHAAPPLRISPLAVLSRYFAADRTSLDDALLQWSRRSYGEEAAAHRPCEAVLRGLKEAKVSLVASYGIFSKKTAAGKIHDGGDDDDDGDAKTKESTVAEAVGGKRNAAEGVRGGGVDADDDTTPSPSQEEGKRRCFAETQNPFTDITNMTNTAEGRRAGEGAKGHNGGAGGRRQMLMVCDDDDDDPYLMDRPVIVPSSSSAKSSSGRKSDGVVVATDNSGEKDPFYLRTVTIKCVASAVGRARRDSVRAQQGQLHHRAINGGVLM